MFKNRFQNSIFILLIFSVSCKIIPAKKIEYETNCYYTIKNKYIDKSLPENKAYIHGKVSVFDNLKQHKLQGSGGCVIVNNEKKWLYNNSQIYSIKLPIGKTVLKFQDNWSVYSYITNIIDIKNQDNIELDVRIYLRSTLAPSNEMFMQEKK